MKILFLTIGRLRSVQDHAIYPDLLRCLRDAGHEIYAVSANEKRHGLTTAVTKQDGIRLLQVRIGNIIKCGLLQKGISMLRLPSQYWSAIKNYFPNVKFDLVLYSTPPISLVNTVKKIKKQTGAKSYLLLKDIYPQNAVDLGVLKKTGCRAPIYHYFRRLEKELYRISDRIGCMSQANVDYLLTHNSFLSPSKVEICPNAIEVLDTRVDQQTRRQIRDRYGLPQDKVIFVCGGNLGRPQGVDFLLDCLLNQNHDPNAFFLLIGDGTHYHKIESALQQTKRSNIRLIEALPKDQYDRMVAACDVGLIALDHRFTVPNFPSRLLIYLQAGLPVLAATDPVTDLKDVIVQGDFGWWCESNNPQAFCKAVEQALHADRSSKGERGRQYLLSNYTVQQCKRCITEQQ